MTPDFPLNMRIRLAQLKFCLLHPDVAKSLPCWLSHFRKAELRQLTWQRLSDVRVQQKNSIGGKEASKKPIPVQMQTLDSLFRSSGLGVRPRMDSFRKIQILKRNNPKQFVIPSHSAAHSNIISAIFAIKSRAIHCS